ncbi:CinA family protein [Caulobacter segnis]
MAGSAADIVLAVTGFAGRGAPGDEPGLVFLAIGRRGAEVEVSEHHFGDVGRGAVRIRLPGRWPGPASSCPDHNGFSDIQK